VRKIIRLIALFLVIIFIVSCSANDTGDTEYLGGRTAEERDAVHIDFDLSWLSATVLSAEVMNIYSDGRANLGKTIRVRGIYDNFYHPQLRIYIHQILTLEGDDCCREGFEFRWSGNNEPSDGFPPLGSFIEVDGVLKIHQDLGQPLLYLEVDEVFILR
jgi:hypothetical protein